VAAASAGALLMARAISQGRISVLFFAAAFINNSDDYAFPGLLMAFTAVRLFIFKDVYLGPRLSQ
jgi:hypothetical protein